MSSGVPHPFWVIVQKEVSDHIRSWRYIILVFILALTCLGSLYTATSTIREAASAVDGENSFLFLKMFTITDEKGTLPPFISFVTFLGPLLGIALGFDAINSERNKGTLIRTISQPIPRDYLINAKFLAGLIVISLMLFALGFLVMGLGIIAIGIPPTPDEFLRILAYLILSVFYVAFWLNLSILFSIRFRQAATSALSSLAVWLFFSVFYSMIVNVINEATLPQNGTATAEQVVGQQELVLALLRLSPSYLFSEATTTLLTPTFTPTGPLTIEQVYGYIPSPLPFIESLVHVWPQVTGLIAATMVCFGISYLLFMRQEVRT